VRQFHVISNDLMQVVAFCEGAERRQMSQKYVGTVKFGAAVFQIVNHRPAYFAR